MNTSKMLRASWGDWASQSMRPAGPAWLQYVWTFVFSMLVAAGFTIVGFMMFASGEGAWRNLAGWGTWYLNYLVTSLAIGYSIHLLFDLGRWALGPARIQRLAAWQRTLYFSLIPFAGVVIGLTVGTTLLGKHTHRWALPTDSNAVAGSLLFSVLVFIMFQTYFATRSRRLMAERRAAQAQLQLLQAQMEPHFLFNTLANVVSLIEVDPPRAKVMLESFTDYLRASLGSLRETEHSLCDELALIDAYLRVVKVRMEDRLSYRIDVPDTLRAMRVPALSLQPLVENAVVHGLEPTIAGGHLLIEARADDARALVITVTDDGRGLEAAGASISSGTGTALKNIRERLAQSHDERAGLTLGPAAPRGTRATLTLPMPT